MSHQYIYEKKRDKSYDEIVAELCSQGLANKKDFELKKQGIIISKKKLDSKSLEFVGNLERKFVE